MPLAKRSKDRRLAVTWEVVTDPDSEQRILQAYELLLRKIDNPQGGFDKTRQNRNDPGRADGP